MTESEKQNLVSLLDQLVSTSVPKASSFEKYGGTLYTVQPDVVEGQFCGIFTFKKHVQLSFANGNQLEDPDGVLSGSGKFRRHINFQAPDAIDEKVIKRLLKQSARLSRSE